MESTESRVREILVRHRHGGFSLAYQVRQGKQAVEFVINSYRTDQPCKITGDKLWMLSPQGVEMHSPTPAYEGQEPLRDCSVTGGDCYADGSSGYGQRLFDEYWLHGLTEAIWKSLDETLDHEVQP